MQPPLPQFAPSFRRFGLLVALPLLLALAGCGGSSSGGSTSSGNSNNNGNSNSSSGGGSSSSSGSTSSSGSSSSGTSSSTAPSITTQPASQSVRAGSTVTLSVAASGLGTLTYQWQKNGSAISGATSASYTTPALYFSDSGSTFSVTVSNSQGSTTSSTATLTIASSLTDTSITDDLCYTTLGADTLGACSSADASLGLQDGHSLTALSYSQVPGQAVTDCVKDNITGLTWEVKTNDGGLRDKDNAYTNYHTDHGSTSAQMNASTNTYGYVNDVNAAKLCGYSDWRLPTIAELQSLVYYSIASPGPTINPPWFPNTARRSYWSSSQYADTSYNSAWILNFGVGSSISYSRSDGGIHVRLVRGQTAASPTFIFSSDNTEVTDNRTGLIWRRCPEGMSWNALTFTCTGSAATYTHEAALQRAKSQATSTGVAWRLPDIKELSSIVDNTELAPATDTSAFPATPSNYFWSSTPYVGDTRFVWYVNFYEGIFNAYGRSLALHVRLVRTSQ